MVIAAEGESQRGSGLELGELHHALDPIENAFDVASQGEPRELRCSRDGPEREDEAVRNRGDEHKGLPYESGIDTYGDTHGRFGLSFYIYALLFVAFDIEVIFIYLWAIAFRDLLLGGLASMGLFVLILLLGLAYAWRKGALSWR